jgi:hypothetical protein
MAFTSKVLPGKEFNSARSAKRATRKALDHAKNQVMAAIKAGDKDKVGELLEAMAKLGISMKQVQK